jgi:AbrB family looped-hinge helix DNA binding protein
MSTMRTAKITAGGQISIPAEVRRRWGTTRVLIKDEGEELVLTPLPDDPIAAAKGAFKGLITTPTEKLREQARRDEQVAEDRKWQTSSTRTRSSR